MSKRKLADHTQGRKLFSSKTASIVVWVITLLWTVPTLGLFVTSFRPKQDVFLSGWWHFFTNPHFTLSNYDSVLFGKGDAGSVGGVIPYFLN